MSSIIMRTTARLILPVLLLFSLIVLVRGHNEPGGGFVGGLLAASAVATYGLAFGFDQAQRLLRLRPLTYAATGLLIAILSGFIATAQGRPYMTGMWVYLPWAPVDDLTKLGTPLLFDIGVYLTVLGVTLLMVFVLAEQPADVREPAERTDGGGGLGEGAGRAEGAPRSAEAGEGGRR